MGKIWTKTTSDKFWVIIVLMITSLFSLYATITPLPETPFTQHWSPKQENRPALAVGKRNSPLPFADLPLQQRALEHLLSRSSLDLSLKRELEPVLSKRPEGAALSLRADLPHLEIKKIELQFTLSHRRPFVMSENYPGFFPLSQLLIDPINSFQLYRDQLYSKTFLGSSHWSIDESLLLPYLESSRTKLDRLLNESLLASIAAPSHLERETINIPQALASRPFKPILCGEVRLFNQWKFSDPALFAALTKRESEREMIDASMNYTVSFIDLSHSLSEILVWKNNFIGSGLKLVDYQTVSHLFRKTKENRPLATESIEKLSHYLVSREILEKNLVLPLIVVADDPSFSLRENLFDASSWKPLLQTAHMQKHFPQIVVQAPLYRPLASPPIKKSLMALKEATPSRHASFSGLNFIEMGDRNLPPSVLNLLSLMKEPKQHLPYTYSSLEEVALPFSLTLAGVYTESFFSQVALFSQKQPVYCPRLLQPLAPRSVLLTEEVTMRSIDESHFAFALDTDEIKLHRASDYSYQPVLAQESDQRIFSLADEIFPPYRLTPAGPYTEKFFSHLGKFAQKQRIGHLILTPSASSFSIANLSKEAAPASKQDEYPFIYAFILDEALTTEDHSKEFEPIDLTFSVYPTSFGQTETPFYEPIYTYSQWSTFIHKKVANLPPFDASPTARHLALNPEAVFKSYQCDLSPPSLALSSSFTTHSLKIQTESYAPVTSIFVYLDYSSETVEYLGATAPSLLTEEINALAGRANFSLSLFPFAASELKRFAPKGENSSVDLMADKEWRYSEPPLATPTIKQLDLSWQPTSDEALSYSLPISSLPFTDAPLKPYSAKVSRLSIIENAAYCDFVNLFASDYSEFIRVVSYDQKGILDQLTPQIDDSIPSTYYVLPHLELTGTIAIALSGSEPDLLSSAPFSSFASIREFARYKNQANRLIHLGLASMPSLAFLKTDSLGDDFDVIVRSTPKKNGDGYYFSILLTPYDKNGVEPIRNHVYFLLDRSVSIEEHRFYTFKKALGQSLNYLSPGTPFNIALIDNEIEWLENRDLALSKQTIQLTKRRLSKISQRGKTDVRIFANLIDELKEKAQDSRDTFTLILLSDGRFMKNIRLQQSILKSLTSDVPDNFAFYAVSASDNNNTAMLDLISGLLRGDHVHAKAHSSFTRKLAGLTKRVHRPLGYSVKVTQIDAQEDTILYDNPALAKPLYADKIYKIFGETQDLGEITLIVQAYNGDRYLNIPKKISFKDAITPSARLNHDFSRELSLIDFLTFIQEGDSTALVRGAGRLDATRLPSPVR